MNSIIKRLVWCGAILCIPILLASNSCEKATAPNEAPQKPNVILFLVDDLGWKDAGSLGSDLYQTPNIDKLVNDGVKFSDAYAACTVCSPSRASLMTGKYPATINCTDWITGHRKPFAKMEVPEWTMYMDTAEYTLAEAMKDEGYSTVHLGKWHLGEIEMYWPENQGFDINLGGYSAGSPTSRGGTYFSPYHNPRLTDGTEGEYLTERLSSEAVSYIADHANSDQPFFMNLWLYNVHTPLQAKEEKIDKYKGLISDSLLHKNPTYAAMVEHMDDALGKVIDQLTASGIYDNTILIFYSDNGGLVGNKKKKVTNNYPLRSGKGDMYEGGVRVPLVISWPKGIKGRSEVETMAISPDIFPTVLGLIESSNEQATATLDGVDLSKLLTNDEAVDREAIYWHYPHYHRQGAKPYSAIRLGDWKLIEIFEEEKIELYNIKEDIGETNDLTAVNPDKTKELYEKLNAWRNKVEAQIPASNSIYDPEFENVWHFSENEKLTEEELQMLKEKAIAKRNKKNVKH